MTKEALLELRQVSTRIGAVQILTDVDLRIDRGEAVGVIGPNGAGKTTLFNVVTGFLRASSGEVRWLGKTINRVRPYKIARLGLVRTFQNVGGFGDLTVEQNLILATRGRKIGTVEEFRELLDLGPVWRSQVNDCSLATRKLVGIAVAAVREPELLLLDEPLAGLDSVDRDHVVEMIRRVHTSGVTICLIEHDIARVSQLVNRLVVLDTGRKVADGRPDDVLSQPDLVDAYMT